MTKEKKWTESLLDTLWITSILLWILLVIILLLNIFYKFNDNIFSKDFYFIIIILFTFGFFRSEFLWFVKGQIDKKITKELLIDILRDNNHLNESIKNLLNTDDDIKSMIFDKYQEVNESVYSEKGNDNIIKINSNEILLSNVKEEMEDLKNSKQTGISIMEKFINHLKTEGVLEIELKDVYDILIDVYKYHFPNNSYIEAKIRRLLQDMRDQGSIEFIWAWKYRIL